MRAKAFLEGCTLRHFFGWYAADEKDIPQSLDVVINGKVGGHGHIMLHVPRPDVVSQYNLAWAYSFSGKFALDASNWTSFDRPQVHFGLQRDDGTMLGERPMSLRRYAGRVEAGGAWVSGWAIDSLSSEPIEVTLLLDGQPAGKQRAALSRPDVANQYNGHSLAGFKIPLPADRTDGVKMLAIAAADGTIISESSLEDLAIVRATRNSARRKKALDPIELEDHVLPEDDGSSILGADGGTSHFLLKADPKNRQAAIYIRTAASVREAPRLQVVLGENEQTEIVSDRIAALPQGQVWRALFSSLYLEDEPAKETLLTVKMKGEILLRTRITIYPRVEGRVERLSDGLLKGWIVDFGIPADRAPKVDLWLDGALLFSGQAQGTRNDVEKLFPGRKRNAFSFALDSALLAEGSHSISVVDGRGRPLKSKVPEISGTYPHPRLNRLADARPVFIVVPIYNAPTEVEECIESLLRHTKLVPGRTELILLDDCSPDPAIVPLLRRFEGCIGIRVVFQPQNVGYTGNINHGIELAGNADVVLLNSDTRVGPGWLRRLRIAAARRESIGTVTAVSDNAGAFSVPRMNSRNPPPMGMSEEDYARLVMQSAPLIHPCVPTGSGFCMFIKRALLDDIGPFDVEVFPRGYGEENEFCMRALHAGWENVVANDTLVFHERSASFQAAKDTLINEASSKMPELYPEYKTAVSHAFLRGIEMQLARHAVESIRLHSGRIRPRVAFVIGVDSGGTPQTNMDLMSSIQEDFEPWLLLCKGSEVVVFRVEGRVSTEVERHRVTPRVEPISHDSSAYRDIITDLLQRYAFELVHIRHIARNGLSLIPVAQRLDIPVIFSLHDFYTVCPNIKLLDGEGNFCGGRCTEGAAECKVEIWQAHEVPPLRKAWVRSWQSRFRDLLAGCDHLITTSVAAREIIQDIHRIDTPFSVIEHGRDFGLMHKVGRPLERGEKLRIVVPGNLSVPKGLGVIEAVHELDTGGRLEFHFFGKQERDVSKLGVNHGPYEREALPDLIAKVRPHLGAVLSVWPETYSHTLTELWACGLPVIGGGLGATGERIQRHGGGWALDDMSPRAVYRMLLSIADDPKGLAEEVAHVIAWQEGYGNQYGIDAMASRYRRIYWSLLDRGAPRAHVVAISIGEVADHKGAVGTILEQKVGPHRLNHLRNASPESLKALSSDGIDAILVRYGGEPQGGVDETLQLVKSVPDVPVVLELMPGCHMPMAPDGSHRTPILNALRNKATHVVGLKEEKVMVSHEQGPELLMAV